MIYTVQNNLKPKTQNSLRVQPKQQADAAVNIRETRCMKVSTLRVIQRVTKYKIVIGKNIGLVNKIPCNISQITQDDTNHSSLIYGNLKERCFQDKSHVSTYRL